MGVGPSPRTTAACEPALAGRARCYGLEIGATGNSMNDNCVGPCSSV